MQKGLCFPFLCLSCAKELGSWRVCVWCPARTCFCRRRARLRSRFAPLSSVAAPGFCSGLCRPRNRLFVLAVPKPIDGGGEWGGRQGAEPNVSRCCALLSGGLRSPCGGCGDHPIPTLRDRQERERQGDFWVRCWDSDHVMLSNQPLLPSSPKLAAIFVVPAGAAVSLDVSGKIHRNPLRLFTLRSEKPRLNSCILLPKPRVEYGEPDYKHDLHGGAPRTPSTTLTSVVL